MGALEKFLGSPKEIDVNGMKLTIKPLKVKDMAKFAKTNPTEEESKRIGKEIIMLSIEGTTEEEVDELPMEIFTKILNEINLLNGFTDENTERIKQFAKQRESAKKSD
jgi:hypothetical protein